ncbi:MAG: energy-coupling factor transporter ATPase [Peptococcaceae bacterium]|nr:energy-coupling factor transporter ATPase [Peptococcaceae bacterium]
MSIVVEDLYHTYMAGTPFENEVLHGINLTIEDGEMVGIIGPTQSGKSTLVQFFNALYVPVRGKVLVNGVDTRDKTANLRDLRRQVALVFQYPEYQLFEETVAKDVAFGPKSMGLSQQELREVVKKSLSAVGLPPDDFFNRYIFALSGGQKRRVAIAGVLALNPRVLILDDPTAGLDPRGREEILAEIRRFHTELGLTVIFVSNNMEDVCRLADRLVVMFDGRTVADGPTREVITSPALVEKYGLRAPQLVEAVWRLRAGGLEIRPDIISLEEFEEEIVRLVKEGRIKPGRPAGEVDG